MRENDSLILAGFVKVCVTECEGKWGWADFFGLFYLVGSATTLSIRVRIIFPQYSKFLNFYPVWSRTNGFRLGLKICGSKLDWSLIYCVSDVTYLAEPNLLGL